MILTERDVEYIDSELIPYLTTFNHFSLEYPGTMLYMPDGGREACYCTIGWEQEPGEALVIPIQVERYETDDKVTWIATDDAMEIPFTLCHVVEEDAEKFNDVVCAIMRARRA